MTAGPFSACKKGSLERCLCAGAAASSPCMAPMGCGPLVGPPAVPKRAQCEAAQHLSGVLTALSEPSLKVLCSVCWFLFSRHKKGPGAVCPSDAAVPVELGLSSSLAKALSYLKSCPEVPSSSFPPETFLLLTTWFQLLWRPYTM